MSFEPFKLTWKGRDVIIPARRCLGAIAACETHLCMSELEDYLLARRTLPFAKISAAYAAVLQYAGLNVTGDQVYEEMLVDGVSSVEAVCLAALTDLQSLMVPPHLRNKMVEVPQEGNGQAQPAALATAGTKDPSKPSTKRSSQTRKARGSRRRSSGG